MRFTTDDLIKLLSITQERLQRQSRACEDAAKYLRGEPTDASLHHLIFNLELMPPSDTTRMVVKQLKTLETNNVQIR
jgi:hypothetical protein